MALTSIFYLSRACWVILELFLLSEKQGRAYSWCARHCLPIAKYKYMFRACPFSHFFSIIQPRRPFNIGFSTNSNTELLFA